MNERNPEQTPLDFDPKAHARTDDLSTSKAAAHSIVNASAIMGIILSNLNVHGPRTQAELAQLCGLHDSQVWKRLSDLKNLKRIEPTGVTRPGPSGRQQTVWRAVESA